MSSQPARALRRERRAATLAQRRAAPRRASTRKPRGIGIGLVSGVALGAGLLVVTAIAVLGGRSTAPPVSVAVARAPAGIPAQGQVLGHAAAPVTLDLYEDFQCPACLRWGQTVFPSLVRNEIDRGTVKIAFHGFAFIGPESRDAERAAWAADRQGRFWDMWATLYANQGLRENGGSFRRERLVAMADELGLDVARFSADLDSPEATAFVANGAAAAHRAGVSSTPTVIVNGAVVEGGYTETSAAIAAAVGP
jgi:protein-disulfide isomerase